MAMPSEDPSVRRLPDLRGPESPVVAKRPVRVMRWATSVIEDGMLPLSEGIHQLLSRGVRPIVNDIVGIRDAWKGNSRVRWRSRVVKVSVGLGTSGVLYYVIHHFVLH